jgi:hypothetical protein
MTSSEFLEFASFLSDLLYHFVAFMCGLILGYMVGYGNGDDF